MLLLRRKEEEDELLAKEWITKKNIESDKANSVRAHSALSFWVNKIKLCIRKIILNKLIL
jgi:hypothetical protein